MIHNGVNKKKKSIHSHLNYDRQLQVYKNINVLMTWNIIWQVSRSIFSLHRVMSLGCRLRVRGCLLLPASQSLLVIVGSQVTLVSGNRSSWKYSNYICKLKFTLNFLYTGTFICVLKNCSDTMCIQHINGAFLQKCMHNHCEVKLASFFESQLLPVSIFKFNSVCTFNKVHSFCLLQDNELFSKLWNNIIKNAWVQKTKFKLFLINARIYMVCLKQNAEDII